jgi:hypothetical protein
MRLLKFLSILCLLIVYGCGSSPKSIAPNSYGTNKALLYATSAMQTDSIGFNIVTGLSELLYPRIVTGDVPIWENEKKEKVLGGQAFIELEKKSKSPFVVGSNLFIHEEWQLLQRHFTFDISGFSFTGNANDGTLLTFGFIDVQDVIVLLRTEKIATNANGGDDLTYWNALQSKQFGFNLVHWDESNYHSNRRLLNDIQQQALFQSRVFREFYKPTTNKQIAYRILPPTINSNTENAVFYKSLQRYVNSNKQIILNADSDKHFSHIALEPWSIDNITIIEQWQKTNSIPLQSVKGIELFIDRHSIILSENELDELDMKINFRGLQEYLSEKRFDFVLEKINRQEIEPPRSEEFYNALLTKPWNKINE